MAAEVVVSATGQDGQQIQDQVSHWGVSAHMKTCSKPASSAELSVRAEFSVRCVHMKEKSS